MVVAAVATVVVVAAVVAELGIQVVGGQVLLLSLTREQTMR